MPSVRIAALGLLLAVWVVFSVPHPGSSAPDGGFLDADRSCAGLSPPSDGFISAGFAPGPNYSGHWGIDYLDDSDGFVVAAASGAVTFAGLVVGNLAVTVDHGGGLKTSYSRLGAASVTAGQRVARGEVIGLTGAENAGHGHGDLHFSVRIDGEYVDPEPLLGCVPREPWAGLRLVGAW